MTQRQMRQTCLVMSGLVGQLGMSCHDMWRYVATNEPNLAHSGEAVRTSPLSSRQSFGPLMATASFFYQVARRECTGRNTWDAQPFENSKPMFKAHLKMLYNEFDELVTVCRFLIFLDMSHHKTC